MLAQRSFNNNSAINTDLSAVESSPLATQSKVRKLSQFFKGDLLSSSDEPGKLSSFIGKPSESLSIGAFSSDIKAADSAENQKQPLPRESMNSQLSKVSCNNDFRALTPFSSNKLNKSPTLERTALVLPTKVIAKMRQNSQNSLENIKAWTDSQPGPSAPASPSRSIKSKKIMDTPNNRSVEKSVERKSQEYRQSTKKSFGGILSPLFGDNSKITEVHNSSVSTEKSVRKKGALSKLKAVVERRKQMSKINEEKRKKMEEAKKERNMSKRANIDAYGQDFVDTRALSYGQQYIRNAYLNDVLCLKSMQNFPLRRDMRRVSLGNYNCYDDVSGSPLKMKQMERVHHFLQINNQVYPMYHRQMLKQEEQQKRALEKLNQVNSREGSRESPSKRKKRLQNSQNIQLASPVFKSSPRSGSGNQKQSSPTSPGLKSPLSNPFKNRKESTKQSVLSSTHNAAWKPSQKMFGVEDRQGKSKQQKKPPMTPDLVQDFQIENDQGVNAVFSHESSLFDKQNSKSSSSRQTKMKVAIQEVEKEDNKIPFVGYQSSKTSKFLDPQQREFQNRNTLVMMKTQGATKRQPTLKPKTLDSGLTFELIEESEKTPTVVDTEEAFEDACKRFDSKESPTGHAIQSLEEFDQLLNENRAFTTQIIENLYLEHGGHGHGDQSSLPKIATDSAQLNLLKRPSTLGLYQSKLKQQNHKSVDFAQEEIYKLIQNKLKQLQKKAKRRSSKLSVFEFKNESATKLPNSRYTPVTMIPDEQQNEAFVRRYLSFAREKSQSKSGEIEMPYLSSYDKQKEVQVKSQQSEDLSPVMPEKKVGVSQDNLRFGVVNWSKVKNTGKNAESARHHLSGSNTIRLPQPIKPSPQRSYNKLSLVESSKHKSRSLSRASKINGLPRYMSMPESKKMNLTSRLFAEKHTDNKDLQSTLNNLNSFIESAQRTQSKLMSQTAKQSKRVKKGLKKIRLGNHKMQQQQHSLGKQEVRDVKNELTSEQEQVFPEDSDSMAFDSPRKSESVQDIARRLQESVSGNFALSGVVSPTARNLKNMKTHERRQLVAEELVKLQMQQQAKKEQERRLKQVLKEQKQQKRAGSQKQVYHHQFAKNASIQQNRPSRASSPHSRVTNRQSPTFSQSQNPITISQLNQSLSASKKSRSPSPSKSPVTRDDNLMDNSLFISKESATLPKPAKKKKRNKSELKKIQYMTHKEKMERSLQRDLKNIKYDNNEYHSLISNRHFFNQFNKIAAIDGHVIKSVVSSSGCNNYIFKVQKDKQNDLSRLRNQLSTSQTY